MFSASLELILNVAYREAASRRHTISPWSICSTPLPTIPRASGFCRPAGRNCRPCGARWTSSSARWRPSGARSGPTSPPRHSASVACCKRRCCTCKARGRTRSGLADVLAAILQQPKAYAAQVLEAQGITRLDVLNFISHGISKAPLITGDTEKQNESAEGGIRRGRAGNRARPALGVCRQPVGTGKGRQNSTRSSAGPTSCNAQWRSSAGGARTTPSSSGTLVSARPRLPKGWRRAWSRTMRQALDRR